MNTSSKRPTPTWMYSAPGADRGTARGTAKPTWWSQHREASLNWLALGLLLAAWNASDTDSPAHAKPRPESLRGYACVSVRAQRCAAAP